MKNLITYKLFESSYDEMKSIFDNLKDLSIEFSDNNCQYKLFPQDDIKINLLSLKSRGILKPVIPFYIEVDIDRRIITPDDKRSGFGPLPNWFIENCRRIEDYMNSEGYKTYISKRYAIDWENLDSIDDLAEQKDLIYKVKLEFVK